MMIKFAIVYDSTALVANQSRVTDIEHNNDFNVAVSPFETIFQRIRELARSTRR